MNYMKLSAVDSPVWWTNRDGEMLRKQAEFSYLKHTRQAVNLNQAFEVK